MAAVVWEATAFSRPHRTTAAVKIAIARNIIQSLFARYSIEDCLATATSVRIILSTFYTK